MTIFVKVERFILWFLFGVFIMRTIQEVVFDRIVGWMFLA